MKKLFLAWVGQNATTGTPNPLTGRMNKYGTLHVFSSKKLRVLIPFISGNDYFKKHT